MAKETSCASDRRALEARRRPNDGIDHRLVTREEERGDEGEEEYEGEAVQGLNDGLAGVLPLSLLLAAA
jgi:hypothetical protein